MDHMIQIHNFCLDSFINTVPNLQIRTAGKLSRGGCLCDVFFQVHGSHEVGLNSVCSLLKSKFSEVTGLAHKDIPHSLGTL